MFLETWLETSRLKVCARVLLQNDWRRDTTLLSFSEQLNLLEQRILFWLTHGRAKIRLSEREKATVDLIQFLSDPITEVEVIFREVNAIVFASQAGHYRLRAGVEAADLSRIVTMASAVFEAYSSAERTREMKGLNKWAYDFVLKPLLLAVELFQISE